jgi:hypothetical protein
MLVQIFIGLIAMLLGVVFLVWGYKAFLILLPIAGFIAGFILGAELIASLLGEGFLSTLTGWIVGLLVGIGLALLSYFIYSFGIAILAGVIGLGLGAGLVTAMEVDSSLIRAVVPLAGAFIGIGLAIFLDIKKYLIIFLTVLSGATASVTGVMLVLNQASLEEFGSGTDLIQELVNNSFLWIIIWIALIIFGIAIQAQLTRGFMIDSDLGYIGRLKDVPDN